jgi:hypothetical protein
LIFCEKILQAGTLSRVAGVQLYKEEGGDEKEVK